MTVRRWIVRGVVQGVGFRWFVRREAGRLGVRGYARNRGDGSVEVVAEGEDVVLHALLEVLREGPPGSHVAGVETAGDAAPAPMPDGFEIH